MTVMSDEQESQKHSGNSMAARDNGQMTRGEGQIQDSTFKVKTRFRIKTRFKIKT